ncbi:decaprenyl-phosphate phosphoribosyltransferase [Haloterrigena sp. SYSU A558-1]|uniref:Decaprenyl-phosphate phosphoribosyltransferase n=1 Tax=Haloterrigena gelatinilytica TaxID=2741724 RepID=A0ABX2LG42_9EURY|nr:decaprenyl-phosphate phosphoribosyltransferase [Haloterrigena gelatinilytica]NUC74338.1 decaprenyl-phosphate phosphoribosyltransferase [Haloterrigena gelatinilytica]
MNRAYADRSRVAVTVSGLVREIRPWQWYKQGILLVGLVFSRSLFDPVAVTNVALGIVAFCAVAGTTYIGNDILDIEEDRNHPRKKHRPIASGRVPVSVAVAFAILLFAGGLTLSWYLGPLFLLVVCAYLVQNALYSAFLKEVVIVDVMVIAIGFVLRAVAGVVAIDVSLSPWLVVCTFLGALMLALGKRRHEMVVSDDPAASRATLAEYTEETLDQWLVVVLAALLVSYSLYTFFRGGPWMMTTLPFAFFATFRYHLLVYTRTLGGDPKFLFADPPFLINLVVWGLLVVAVLYRVPPRLLEVIA